LRLQQPDADRAALAHVASFLHSVMHTSCYLCGL
jgi:hypothetical protein